MFSIVFLLSTLLIATTTFLLLRLNMSLTTKSLVVIPSFPSTIKITTSASSIAISACILISLLKASSPISIPPVSITLNL